MENAVDFVRLSCGCLKVFCVMFSTIPRTGCDLVLRFLLFGGFDFTSRFLFYVFSYSADGCSFGTANRMLPRTLIRAMCIWYSKSCAPVGGCAFATANPFPPRTRIRGVDSCVRGEAFLRYVFCYPVDGCPFGTANPTPPRTDMHARSIISIHF